jgi:hypothetical protein
MKKINKYDVIRYIVLLLVVIFIQILFNEFVYRTDGLSTIYGMLLLFIGITLNETFIDIMNSIRVDIELKKLAKELDKILEDYRKELTNEGGNKDDSK